MRNKTPYYEDIKTDAVGEFLSSTVRPATKKEILMAKKLHKKGKCPHTIIDDICGYPYDLRYCVTCGKGLGTI